MSILSINIRQIKCKLGFHDFSYWNETNRDCFRRCDYCKIVQFLYPFSLKWARWYNQDVDLSKFKYIGKR